MDAKSWWYIASSSPNGGKVDKFILGTGTGSTMVWSIPGFRTDTGPEMVWSIPGLRADTDSKMFRLIPGLRTEGIGILLPLFSAELAKSFKSEPESVISEGERKQRIRYHTSWILITCIPIPAVRSSSNTSPQG